MHLHLFLQQFYPATVMSMNTTNRVFLSAVMPFATSAFPEFDGFRDEQQVCIRHFLISFSILFENKMCLSVVNHQELLLPIPPVRIDLASGQSVSWEHGSVGRSYFFKNKIWNITKKKEYFLWMLTEAIWGHSVATRHILPVRTLISSWATARITMWTLKMRRGVIISKNSNAIDSLCLLWTAMMICGIQKDWEQRKSKKREKEMKK